MRCSLGFTAYAGALGFARVGSGGLDVVANGTGRRHESAPDAAPDVELRRAKLADRRIRAYACSVVRFLDASMSH